MRALLLCLAVVCCFGSAHTQTKPPISCAQAVKMGFHKFMEAETARTGDYSTAGTIAACDQYRKCKRQTNDRVLKVLSSAQQSQMATVRRELGKLESAIWTMVYIQAGGGTMYSQFAAAGAATREDVFGDLIVAMRARKNQTSPKAIKVLWSQATRSLAPQLQTPHNPSSGAFGSVAETRKQYEKSAQEAQAAMNALKALSERLPAGAANIVAQHVAQVASNSFQTI